MSRLLRFWHSSLGKKVVMGVTGAIGVLFVLGHVVGNLLVFKGPEAFNAYGAFLHSLGGGLWAARLGLLAAVVLHVTAAVQLTLRARAARPVGYAAREPQVSTLASRTMRVGGLVLLFFIVFHLLHFTTGDAHHDFVAGDVYHNVVSAFRRPVVAAAYVVAMAALGLHLFHGTWSAVRTLGLARPAEAPLKRRVAVLLAVGVAGAFASIPLAILAGVVR